MLPAFVISLALVALPCRTSSPVGLHGDTPAGIPVRADETPAVLRAYDVTNASPVAAQQEGSAIPHVRVTGTDVDGVLGIVRSSESCVEILRSLQPDQWESANNELSLGQDGRLIVLAPPALQETVASELAFLAETFGRGVRIEVDAVLMKSTAADTLPALVPVADLAHWFGAGSEHQSHELSAPPGARAWMQALHTIDMVGSYDINIAERAVAYAAIFERAFAGLSVECVSTPAPGGSWLAMNVQDVRPAGEVEEADLRLESRFVTDSGSSVGHGPSRRQTLRLHVLSCALNAFMPDGKALALRGTTDTEQGTTRVIFVHQEGASTGAITRLPEGLKRAAGSSDAAFVRTDAYALPTARLASTNGMIALPSLAHYTEFGSQEQYASPSFELSTGDQVATHIQLEEGLSFSSAGVWTVLFATDSAKVDKALAHISPLLPDARTVGVTLTLKRGTQGSAVLDRAVVAVRTGARSTIVLGQESSSILASEPYVAQGATASHARVFTVFEGLAVGIEPRSTSAGELTLTLDAHARSAHGQPREFDPGTMSVPIFHQQDADLLDVQRTVTFAKSDNGPRRIVLGNAGSSADALTLEVEVVDLR